jgi:2-methylcitrate dehydratase PrpD
MELTAELMTSAKLCIMDSITTAVAGYETPVGQKLLTLVNTAGGNPQASLLGTGVKSSLLWAALANATAAHALDFDDAHATEPGHPTAPVLPAALGLGEWKSLDGPTIMRALITGIHVMFAVGAAIMPEHYQRGWHNTGTMGHFGAVAAAGIVLGLNTDQLSTSLGIAASQAAGLQVNFGSMTKPFHAGKAALNGLMAALLAEDGFTASQNILDDGFLNVLAVSPPDSAKLVEVLEGPPQIFEVHFKRYPCCFGTHPAIRSALRLRKKHNLRFADIEKVEGMVYPRGMQVANVPLPTTGLEAKFSIAYCTARALIDGLVGLEAFEEEAVMEQEVQDLLRRITLVPEPTYQDTRSTTIRVHAKDGRVLEDTTNLLVELGDIELDKVDIPTKFKQVLESRLGTARLERLSNLIFDLENLRDVGVIADLLCER